MAWERNNDKIMKKELSIVSAERIENSIYVVRDKRVMLDQDLAVLYDTSTKRLNEQFRRNIDRFPDDFAFRLKKDEWKILRSQIATLKKKHGEHRKYLPYVFTEYGTLMLANILRSERATKMSVQIIRAFIHIRQLMSSHKAIAKEVSELKSFVLKHSRDTSQEFRRVWNVIEKLSSPPAKNNPIGFSLD